METSEIKILNKDGKIYAFLKGGISFSLDLKFDVLKHDFIWGPVGDTFTWKREIVPSFLEKLEVML